MGRRKHWQRQRDRGGKPKAGAAVDSAADSATTGAAERLQKSSGGSHLWIYGVHPVLAVLGNPARRLHKLVGTADALRQHKSDLDRNLRNHTHSIVIETFSRQNIDRFLPSGAVHQGLACQVDPLPSLALEDIADAATGRRRAVVVVLDQVTDPHNVGAILRSAAAFGAMAVVVTERHGAPETGVLAKAASGALEHVPIVRITNLSQALETLKEAGFWCVGLAGDGDRLLAEVDGSGRIALVLGAEGAGLRRLTREHCDVLARLPTSGPIDQLNVSNAAAIALYELARGGALPAEPGDQ